MVGGENGADGRLHWLPTGPGHGRFNRELVRDDRRDDPTLFGEHSDAIGCSKQLGA